MFIFTIKHNILLVDNQRNKVRCIYEEFYPLFLLETKPLFFLLAILIASCIAYLIGGWIYVVFLLPCVVVILSPSPSPGNKNVFKTLHIPIDEKDPLVKNVNTFIRVYVIVLFISLLVAILYKIIF